MLSRKWEVVHVLRKGKTKKRKMEKQIKTDKSTVSLPTEFHSHAHFLFDWEGGFKQFVYHSVFLTKGSHFSVTFISNNYTEVFENVVYPVLLYSLENNRAELIGALPFLSQIIKSMMVLPAKHFQRKSNMCTS